jgi:Spy/CpxP family protein refolding chaperone
MVIKHQVRLAAVVIVAVLASGIFFTFSSIYGSTNVTARIVEQHEVENHFNNTDSDMSDMSSSDIEKNSSQISPYAGQEVRDIKSLSDKDVQSLQNGTGEAFGGIAKQAELNGYPGPRHVLDMASDLQLTDMQRIEIEHIFQNMSGKAKSIGAGIIAIEQDMDRAFANKTITQEKLKQMLDKSAELYGQLRFVHLSAHLDTKQILTIEQVQMYNKMRGYESGGIDSSISDDGSSHQQHSMR